MATKKISELSTYTESSISDATQALVPLDDLTVVGTGKTKHMSFAELAKWFGANLPKLVVSSGTLTASTPFTFSQTWNNVAVSFRGVKIAVTDSASAATSLPLEVLGGAGGVTNLLSARTDGVVQAGTEMRSPLFSTRSDSGEYRLGASDDLSMVRVAADHLGVRRGANAQSLSVFNNYVSASVYERGRFGWSGSNVLQIGTEHVGGSTRAISFIVGGSEKLLMHTNGGLYVASGGLLYSPEFRTGAGHYTIISAPSEGVTLLTDSTAANYARTALGGITNAFPSIARSGANIQIKLADNSALTGLEAKTLTATGGTLTASAPGLSVTQTWNNGAATFAGVEIFVTDSASAGGSRLLELRGGAGAATSLFKVDKVGNLDMTGYMLTTGSAGLLLANDTAGIYLGAASDVVLRREAANHLALRNSTNAQSFSVYGSYTSGSVYNRLRLYNDAGTNYIATEHVGSTAKGLSFMTNGVVRMSIDASANEIYLNDPGIIKTTGSAEAFLRLASDNTVLATIGSVNILIDTDNNASFQSFTIGHNSASTGGDTPLFSVCENGLVALGDPVDAAVPALKKSSTTMQVRLGDDSAFTKLQAQLQTHANAVAESITPTHTLTLYDAAGTAYKVAVQAA